MYVHSNYTFRNQGNDHQVGKWTQWTHSETDLSGDFIYYLTPIYPDFSREPMMVLWTPEYTYQLGP